MHYGVVFVTEITKDTQTSKLTIIVDIKQHHMATLPLGNMIEVYLNSIKDARLL